MPTPYAHHRFASRSGTPFETAGSVDRSGSRRTSDIRRFGLFVLSLLLFSACGTLDHTDKCANVVSDHMQVLDVEVRDRFEAAADAFRERHRVCVYLVALPALTSEQAQQEAIVAIHARVDGFPSWVRQHLAAVPSSRGITLVVSEVEPALTTATPSPLVQVWIGDRLRRSASHSGLLGGTAITELQEYASSRGTGGAALYALEAIDQVWVTRRPGIIAWRTAATIEGPLRPGGGWWYGPFLEFGTLWTRLPYSPSIPPFVSFLLLVVALSGIRRVTVALLAHMRGRLRIPLIVSFLVGWSVLVSLPSMGTLILLGSGRWEDAVAVGAIVGRALAPVPMWTPPGWVMLLIAVAVGALRVFTRALDESMTWNDDSDQASEALGDGILLGAAVFLVPTVVAFWMLVSGVGGFVSQISTHATSSPSDPRRGMGTAASLAIVHVVLLAVLLGAGYAIGDRSSSPDVPEDARDATATGAAADRFILLPSEPIGRGQPERPLQPFNDDDLGTPALPGDALLLRGDIVAQSPGDEFVWSDVDGILHLVAADGRKLARLHFPASGPVEFEVDQEGAALIRYPNRDSSDGRLGQVTCQILAGEDSMPSRVRTTCTRRQLRGDP